MKGLLIPMLEKTTGYVYFVQMDRIGPIKIGFSVNVEKRLLSLQTASPYPLKLLCIIPGSEKLEKEIHYSFREMRMEGEWFLPHPFILKEIDMLIEINKINGFIEPVPEYDIDDPFSEDSNHDLYYSHIRGAKFDWRRFIASDDFQVFKSEKDKDIRDSILDKYIIGYYKNEEETES
jgi:hypothetical protein